MQIRDGGEVAILKQLSDGPSSVIEIAIVHHAGPVFIQLIDGRMYSTLGGLGLNTTGCIVPAHEEHRTAIAKRVKNPGSNGDSAGAVESGPADFKTLLNSEACTNE